MSRLLPFPPRKGIFAKIISVITTCVIFINSSITGWYGLLWQRERIGNSEKRIGIVRIVGTVHHRHGQTPHRQDKLDNRTARIAEVKMNRNKISMPVLKDKSRKIMGELKRYQIEFIGRYVEGQKESSVLSL